MFSKKNYNTTIYGWLKSHDFYSSHNQVLTSLKTHQVPRKTCQNPIKNLPKRHDTPVFLASQNIKIQKKNTSSQDPKTIKNLLKKTIHPIPHRFRGALPPSTRKTPLGSAGSVETPPPLRPWAPTAAATGRPADDALAADCRKEKRTCHGFHD